MIQRAIMEWRWRRIACTFLDRRRCGTQNRVCSLFAVSVVPFIAYWVCRCPTVFMTQHLETVAASLRPENSLRTMKLFLSANEAKCINHPSAKLPYNRGHTPTMDVQDCQGRGSPWLHSYTFHTLTQIVHVHLWKLWGVCPRMHVKFLKFQVHGCTPWSNVRTSIIYMCFVYVCVCVCVCVNSL